MDQDKTEYISSSQQPKPTDAVLVLRGLEELYPELRFVERLRHCVETYPRNNWGDAMSRGQITSKQWILHQLVLTGTNRLGRVAVCGGWLGVLSRLILDNPDVHTTHIESLDLDLESTIVAGELNEEYIANDTFLARVADCHVIDYDDYDTIINTSCEHFSRWWTWWDRIPVGKLVILQSNDFVDGEGHVNCVASPEALASTAPMSQVIFKGSLPTYKYTRFMVIGVK